MYIRTVYSSRRHDDTISGASNVLYTYARACRWVTRRDQSELSAPYQMGNIECTGGGDARASRRTKPPLTREDSEFDNEASVADTTEPSASSSTGSWWSNLTGTHIVNAHIDREHIHALLQSRGGLVSLIACYSGAWRVLVHC